MTKEELGLMLKAARIREGFSQEELRGAAGLGMSYIGKLEKGKCQGVPTAGPIRRIAEFLDLNPDQLVEAVTEAYGGYRLKDRVEILGNQLKAAQERVQVLQEELTTVGAVAMHLAEITLWHWDANGNRYDNRESSDNAKALARRVLNLVDPVGGE